MSHIQIKKENLVEILEVYVRELKNNSYAANSIKIYSRYLEKFLQFSFDHPDLIPDERIACFIDTCQTRVVRSQAYSAVKQFYILILKKNIPYKIKHKKKKNLLPEVWDKEDILKLLDHIKNSKHRLMIAMLYGSGLRVGEVTRIRISDIDFKRFHLRIRGAKGFKDRVTVFSEKLKDPILELTIGRDPRSFLFVTNLGKPYKIRTVQVIMEKARLSASITKKGSCHTMRHSFATHLMEDGVSIKSIQKMLGHKKIDTTAVYIHVMSLRSDEIKSPL